MLGVAVGRGLGSGLGLETLEAGPRVDERAIHGEVSVADPAVFAGQRDQAGEEEFGGAVLEQPVLVLAEGGGIPDGVQQVEVEEQAEEKIVVEGFDQQGFGADGVEGLQHLGFEQALGRDGGAPQFGIHLVEERVVLRPAARGREQAQHVGLGIHLATHAVSDLRKFTAVQSARDFFNELLESICLSWTESFGGVFRVVFVPSGFFKSLLIAAGTPPGSAGRWPTRIAALQHFC